jgi:integrase/recombinase XerD
MVLSCHVRISGPLVPHLPSLEDDLLAQGYAPLSCRDLLRLTSHLSRWLEEEGLQAQDLTDEVAEAFLVARRELGYARFLTQRALTPIRRHLLAAGVTPAARPAMVEHTAVDCLVNDYKGHLLDERGLGPSFVRRCVTVARKLLVEHSKYGDADIASLDAAEVLQFVHARSHASSLNQMRSMLTGLRSFLRFLYGRGDVAMNLTGAVPAVAGWRLASLPKYLPPQHVKAILDSCDRRTTIGRRDSAVLLLLARVGLRAGEVAGLDLDDVDWREGVMIIPGKGGRCDRLPLPSEVGAALASYLLRRQRSTDCRSLFLRARAPYARLSRIGVSHIVGRACKRAGLGVVGAHRLRHTTATTMLRKGACLDEVSQVLRHEHLATTAIYAKVDHRRLRELAQPWPGGAQ